MTARPEVVALLADFDVARNGADQWFVHRDGRPFTAEEIELIGTATEEDMLNIVAEPRGNSRLACQIVLTDALNGLIVSLPEAQH